MMALKPILILLGFHTCLGYPTDSPSLWEIFNVTEPEPEFWHSERFRFNASPLSMLGNDMVLTDEQLKQGVTNTNMRWPNGVIPVNIDNRWDQRTRQIIVQGLNLLQSGTCIRFIQYNQNQHRNFVNVEPAGQNFGCRAQVGMQGGYQWVGLEPVPWCLNAPIVAHEFIHATGFWHEHQRPDRDQFIMIDWNNLPQWRYIDFQVNKDLGIFGTPYDFESIMHYPAYLDSALDRNKPVIIPRTNYNGKIGQSEYLTQYDYAKVNNMYKGICQ